MTKEPLAPDPWTPSTFDRDLIAAVDELTPVWGQVVSEADTDDLIVRAITPLLWRHPTKERLALVLFVMHQLSKRHLSIEQEQRLQPLITELILSLAEFQSGMAD